MSSPYWGPSRNSGPDRTLPSVQVLTRLKPAPGTRLIPPVLAEPVKSESCGQSLHGEIILRPPPDPEPPLVNLGNALTPAPMEKNEAKPLTVTIRLHLHSDVNSYRKMAPPMPFAAPPPKMEPVHLTSRPSGSTKRSGSAPTYRYVLIPASSPSGSLSTYRPIDAS